ncbi:MAG: tetratricopeptide repeat protein [Nitrosarchaeum sp.]
MVQIDELISKGKSFLEIENFEDALSYFEQALILNKKNPEIWNFKAVCLRSLGRYEEALECFNQSLKIDPRDKHAS